MKMDVFWAIVVILVILWLVGFFTLPGVGALIHILLVLALIVIVYRLLTARAYKLRPFQRSTTARRVGI
jgi:hypothetical protein